MSSPSPPHLRMEKYPVSEMLYFLVFRILDDEETPKPSNYIIYL
jgi:hypothetical protein